MEIIILASQVVIGLGLLNVWLLRFGAQTEWRGGDAKNMQEEFAVYGLPRSVMVVVGAVKVSLALLLLAGLFVPSLTRPAATGIAVLMAGAVTMHVKVGDPLKKSLPAASILALCLVVLTLG